MHREAKAVFKIGAVPGHINFRNNLDMALNEYSKPMEFRTEIIVDESGEKLQEDKTFDGEQEQ